MKPTRDIVSFFAFISFFPQLVAGPIERASNLLHQFFVKKTFDYSKSISGLRLILWGFFKKVVIADNLGLVVEQLFNNTTNYNIWTTLCGALLFAFQIYCDFSGYSDIAIGLARTLGFELMVNFITPYFSKSFTEFWRRWHISLSSWFRDYIYIPLGGNKGRSYQLYTNILITFILSGLWHGANITFLIWGILHGMMLIIEKIVSFKPKSSFSIPIVFLITILLWLPFRANDFKNLLELVTSLTVTSGSLKDIIDVFIKVHTYNKAVAILVVFILFVLFEYLLNKKDFNTWLNNRNIYLRFASYYALLIGILILGNFNLKPYFIYFQF